MTPTDPEVRRALQKYPTNKAQFQALSAKLQAAESQLSTLREGLRKCLDYFTTIGMGGTLVEELRRILSTSEGSPKGKR